MLVGGHRELRNGIRLNPNNNNDAKSGLGDGRTCTEIFFCFHVYFPQSSLRELRNKKDAFCSGVVVVVSDKKVGSRPSSFLCLFPFPFVLRGRLYDGLSGNGGRMGSKKKKKMAPALRV